MPLPGQLQSRMIWKKRLSPGRIPIEWEGDQAQSSLLTGLVHYWTLDEASGTRADSVGGATLTDNNTVTSTTGVHGSAASVISGNSEYLSVTSFSLPSTPTVSFWFKGTDSNSFSGLFSLGAFGNSTFTAFKDSGAGAIRFTISNGSGQVAVASASGKWDGAFHHVVAWVSADAKAHLVVDGVESVSAGALTGTLFVGPATLQIGRQIDNLTGVVDEVAVWSRVLTPDERATLYNSGAGKFYPSF